VRKRRQFWFDDFRFRLKFERGIRRGGIYFVDEYLRDPRRLRYRFDIEVPVYDDRRRVAVEFPLPNGPANPIVHLDGPPCLRQRWDQDGSLCMWLESDPPTAKWVPGDGLLKLVAHIEEHAFCEQECRLGKPWPKEESPGEHPRKRKCPSCRGQGSP